MLRYFANILHFCLFFTFFLIISVHISAQRADFIFYEDFRSESTLQWKSFLTTDNDYQLKATNSSDTSFYYSDEKVAISNFTLDNFLYYITEQEIDQKLNFKIDFSIQFLNNLAGIELIWGGDGAKKKYAFCIRSLNSSYYYKVLTDDGNETIMIDWTEFADFNFDSVSKISMLKIKDIIEFRVDDQFVCQIPFGNFFGDYIGFKLESPQVVDIYSVSASYLPFVSQLRYRPHREKRASDNLLKIYYPTMLTNSNGITFNRMPFVIGCVADNVRQLYLNDVPVVLTNKNGFAQKVVLQKNANKLIFTLITDDGSIFYRNIELRYKSLPNEKKVDVFKLRFEQKTHVFPFNYDNQKFRVFPYRDKMVIKSKTEPFITYVSDYDGCVFTRKADLSIINYSDFQSWFKYGLILDELVNDTLSELYKPFVCQHFLNSHSSKLYYSDYTNGSLYYRLGTDADNFFIYDFSYYNPNTHVYAYRLLNQKEALFELASDFSIAFQGKNRIDLSQVEIFDSNCNTKGRFCIDSKIDWLAPQGKCAAFLLGVPVFFNKEENYKCLQIFDYRGVEMIRKGNYKHTNNAYKLIDKNKLVVFNSNDISMFDIKNGRLIWENNRGYLTNEKRICTSVCGRFIYIVDYSVRYKKYRFVIVSAHSGRELYKIDFPFDINFSWYENELLFSTRSGEVVYRNESATYRIFVEINK